MRTGRETGLTLVEMLVVLAIIGVMSGMIVLALGRAGPGGTAESEAHRLAARLQLAADETMVTDRALALSTDASGYRFVAWDAARQQWLADSDPALGERHVLARGVALRTDDPDRLQPVGADSGGQATRAVLTDAGSRWTIAFDGVDAHVDAVAR